MPIRLRSLPVSCLLLISFLSCQPSDQKPDTPGYDYFPLETGRYVIYDVQEYQYVLNAPSVQRTYQLKEVTGSSYLDVTGQTAYRIMRYKRSTENQPWQADSAWSARIVNNKAIRSENGQDFVKLMFPVRDLFSWKSDPTNGPDSDEYVMRNVGQPYHVSGKTFDETLTVVAHDDSTLVSQDKRVEVFARQVGLIYKERTQLQFCTATPTCTGHSQIDYGIRQLYHINAYGKE